MCDNAGSRSDKRCGADCLLWRIVFVFRIIRRARIINHCLHVRNQRTPWRIQECRYPAGQDAQGKTTKHIYRARYALNSLLLVYCISLCQHFQTFPSIHHQPTAAKVPFDVLMMAKNKHIINSTLFLVGQILGSTLHAHHALIAVTLGTIFCTLICFQKIDDLISK